MLAPLGPAGGEWLPRLLRLTPLLLLTALSACRSKVVRDPFPGFMVDPPPEISSPLGAVPATGLGRRGFEFGTVAEGQAQKFYYVPGGKGAQYKGLISNLFAGESLRVESFDKFVVDPRAKGLGQDLIVVSAAAEKVEDIEEFLTTLETQVPQVEVEARVVEVFFSDDFQFGATTTLTEEDFDTRTLFDTGTSRMNTRAFIESLTTANVAGFQGGLINLGTIQDGAIANIVIEALARKENTELISTPKLTVLSGCTGTIHTGEETPVPSAVITNSATTVKTDFKQTGISLTITPQVIGTDDIQLLVKPEVSVVTGFTDPANSGGIASPVISSRNAETTVTLKSGKTLVLGGLVAKQEVKVESRVPILGSVPFLKHLFRSIRKEIVRSELLFFITVRITNDTGHYGGNLLIDPEASTSE